MNFDCSERYFTCHCGRHSLRLDVYGRCDVCVTLARWAMAERGMWLAIGAAAAALLAYVTGAL